MGPVNPYAKQRPAAPVAAAVSIINQPAQQQRPVMGPQSQQRVNQTKRAYGLAYSGQKRKGDQLTLQGKKAFQAEKHCVVCHARSLAKFTHNCRVPNRAYHVLCIRNKSTKGKGAISAQNMANTAEEKRLKVLYNTPLTQEEKASGGHLTKAATAAFFEPTKPPHVSKPNTQTSEEKTSIDFGKAVSDIMANPSFCKQHKNKNCPLAMIAFAGEVMERVVRAKNKETFAEYFDGVTMTVPASVGQHDNPHYHSIVVQKLLLVDWVKAFGIQVPCPDSNCQGVLKNERTNYSKNKTLFPIFGVDGPPSWCMVMKMSCPCCRRDFSANEAAVLLTLPAHVAQHYPVETKYALTSHSFHLDRNATNILDNIMVTYTNGELCSRLLYSSINRTYVQKITSYYYYHRTQKSTRKVADYIQKNGAYIKQFPPKATPFGICLTRLLRQRTIDGVSVTTIATHWRFKTSNVNKVSLPKIIHLRPSKIIRRPWVPKQYGTWQQAPEKSLLLYVYLPHRRSTSLMLHEC